MAQYDVVIRGGTIVPGSGVPRYKADLALKNGRIAMISGTIKAGGAKEIDASGCIVAPGAIDLHTHYDAQLNWDPYASLSGWFGVTSLTIGQCGFGFAPTKPKDRELNMRLMNRIEAIPLESMRQGMRWDWESYPEYLNSLDKQGLGINVGSLFPFSPLRGYVLGMLPARHRTSVTERELNEMKQLFYEGMKAGAFGIAGDRSAEDHAEDGGYIPSHVASNEEWYGLMEVLSQFSVGHFGWDIGNVPMFNDRKEQQQLLANMLRISGRPAHVLMGSPGDEVDQGRAWLKAMRDEGLPLVAQMGIVTTADQFRLSEFNLFDTFPNWVQPLVGTPEERAVKLRDPAHRAAMKQDVENVNPQDVTSIARTDWRRMRVVEVMQERNRKYEGMTLLELAEAQQKHPLDSFLDLALDEDLLTEFSHPKGPEDIFNASTGELIKSPYTHISLSDGGAHVRFSPKGIWPIFFLTNWVRDRELMSLEEAHYKMSAYPAWIADFKDRGTLRVGAWADIMIYELDKLGFLYDRITFANDFPGNERRAIQKPVGLRYTLVNGSVTFVENDCTGTLPGKLLRSYDMID